MTTTLCGYVPCGFEATYAADSVGYLPCWIHGSHEVGFWCADGTVSGIQLSVDWRI